MVRSLVIAFFTGVGIVSLLPMYWYVQPDHEFDRPVVHLVEQQFGHSAVLDIPVKNFEIGKSTSLKVSIVDNQDNVVREFSSEITTDSKYKVLTGDQIPEGEYAVYVDVAYQLNPIRSSSQGFQLAVLRVKGTQ